MGLDSIVVRGARQHNLKNITVEIPRRRLTVITGLSGSGKSSLAFDTIYAEGQRRYVESLSAYARQFLDQMERPDVDSIEGLSPAISIEQKTTGSNPRSTVGTVTEIGNSSIVPLNPATSGGSAQAIDFEVRIELREPPEGIRPDLSATADVITATRDQVPSIPITALTLMDADEYEEIPNENLPSAPGSDAARDIEGVFVVEGDIVRFRPVEIGIAGENYFEVVSGIELGTTVVSGSFQAIRELGDGSRIRIHGPAAAGAAANREDGSGGGDAAVNGENGR